MNKNLKSIISAWVFLFSIIVGASIFIRFPQMAEEDFGHLNGLGIIFLSVAFFESVMHFVWTYLEKVEVPCVKISLSFLILGILLLLV